MPAVVVVVQIKFTETMLHQQAALAAVVPVD
jgi:hypothetical protein